MVCCPLGVPGLGEFPLKLGVLASFVIELWDDFLAALGELLPGVFMIPELLPFLLDLVDLDVVGC